MSLTFHKHWGRYLWTTFIFVSLFLRCKSVFSSENELSLFSCVHLVRINYIIFCLACAKGTLLLFLLESIINDSFLQQGAIKCYKMICTIKRIHPNKVHLDIFLFYLLYNKTYFIAPLITVNIVVQDLYSLQQIDTLTSHGFSV